MYSVHPKKYAHGSRFVAFCCGYVPTGVTLVLQGYFTGAGAIGASEATLENIGR